VITRLIFAAESLAAAALWIARSRSAYAFAFAANAAALAGRSAPSAAAIERLCAIALVNEMNVC